MNTDPHAAAARRDYIVAEIVARTGIDAAMIERLVRAFYARARRRFRCSGPIFERHVGNWDAHLARMCDFWSSVALMSGPSTDSRWPRTLRCRSTRRISIAGSNCSRQAAQGGVSAGGGRALHRARAPHRRQPGVRHCRTAWRDPVAADAPAAQHAVRLARNRRTISSKPPRQTNCPAGGLPTGSQANSPGLACGPSKAPAATLQRTKIDVAVQAGEQKRADVKLKCEFAGHDHFRKLRGRDQLKLNPALGRRFAGERGFHEKRMQPVRQPRRARCEGAEGMHRTRGKTRLLQQFALAANGRVLAGVDETGLATSQVKLSSAGRDRRTIAIRPSGNAATMAT